MNIRKQRIRRAFDDATCYEEHAGLQRQEAEGLALRIAALSLPHRPRILEIGCGTGFLAEALIKRVPDGRWLMTDISPAMVERCRQRFGRHEGFGFAVLDGEHPAAAGKPGQFDLICSNLAAQWFEDLPAALLELACLLNPGGWLAVTTLCEGTFTEWRRAHTDCGLAPGTPEYPSVEALRTVKPPGFAAHVESERIVERYDSAAEFVRSVRAIGAGTPSPAHRPLSAAAMRRVMRCFEASGAVVTYHVATCIYGRPLDT